MNPTTPGPRSRTITNSNWILEIIRDHKDKGVSYHDLHLWFKDRIQDYSRAPLGFDALVSELNHRGLIWLHFESNENGTIDSTSCRVFAQFINSFHN